ncbi:hypothetical protein KIH39_00100 [Telmatocola sphagniphila]|uniref:Uncharacterized protein n=1 Tax=Telmatocola sphagniphila TaxID=1123043 RepID=A0A8E6B5Y9_9BACT|nr:hypothetical protein [Telmatocola sphagniphila]QVL32356.1 hypothetical protein KIH39_00100 [Telmatocola sphagniphila]
MKPWFLFNDVPSGLSFIVIPPGTEVTDTPLRSATFDLKTPGLSCKSTQTVNNLEGSTFYGKYQESADGISWTDLAGAAFTFVITSSNIQTINFTSSKRYLRYSCEFDAGDFASCTLGVSLSTS